MQLYPPLKQYSQVGRIYCEIETEFEEVLKPDRSFPVNQLNIDRNQSNILFKPPELLN